MMKLAALRSRSAVALTGATLFAILGLVQGRRGPKARPKCAAGQTCGAKDYTCAAGITAIRESEISYGTRDSPAIVPAVSLKGCTMTQMELATLMRWTMKVPVILQDGPWTTWPIHKTWTWDYLRSAAPAVWDNSMKNIVLEASDNQTFSVFDDKWSVTEHLSRRNLGMQPVLTSAKSAEFFDGLLGIRPFAEGKISRITGNALLILPRLDSDLKVADASGKWYPHRSWDLPMGGNKKQKLPTQISVLVGSAGLISRPHYDCFSNFLLMVRGSKRVRLSPPSDAGLYGIYHGAHPLLYRQSQNEAIPDGARVIQAELREGEILFIPVSWWHYVETLEPSVALSIFKDSDAFDDAAKLLDAANAKGGLDDAVWPIKLGKPRTPLQWVDAMFAMIPRFVQRVGSLCDPEVNFDSVFQTLFPKQALTPDMNDNSEMSRSLTPHVKCSQPTLSKAMKVGLGQVLDAQEAYFKAIPVEERLRFFAERLNEKMILLGGYFLLSQKIVLPAELHARNQISVQAAYAMFRKCKAHLS